MKTANHCPVRGNSSVERNILAGCSAPIGAGEFNAHSSFYRYSATIGAGGSSSHELFYRAFLPDGRKQQCPVRGNSSVERNISAGCSAPIGAGEFNVHSSFYRYSVPIGAVSKHEYLLIDKFYA